MSLEAMTSALKVKGLTQLEKLVLICLANYADAEGRAWPAHEKIAEQCECARESVQRVCRRLAERGLIRIENRTRANGSTSSNMVHMFPTQAEGGVILDHTTLGRGGVTQDHTIGCDLGSQGGVTQDHTQKQLDRNYTTGAQARDEVSEGEGEAEAPEPERQPTALEVDLIALAGDAYQAQAGMPKRLLLLLDDDLPCTVDELKRAVIDAAEWHKRTTGTMTHWNLAYTKASEARDRRLSGAAGPRSGAGGGRLSGALSAKPATARKRKHGAFVAGRGEGRHDLSWSGPPEVRARMVRIHGEEFTHSWLDAAGWNDGVILARNSFARDKLSALPVLSGYRIEVGVSGHAERE